MAIVARKDPSTLASIQPELFSDFFTDLIVHPVKKDLVRHINEDAVKRSVRNLILTNRGDRIYNQSFGSDIRSLLFEPASPVTETAMKSLITTLIDNYEPRAKLQDVSVVSDPDENSLYVTIVFSVINKQEPVTLELILDRIR